MLFPAVVTSGEAFFVYTLTYKFFQRTAMPHLTVLLFLSLKHEQSTTRIPIYVRVDFVISHLYYDHDVGNESGWRSSEVIRISEKVR